MADMTEQEQMMSKKRLDGLTHIADHYNRYPGERVRFFTRAVVEQGQKAATLSVFLPHGIELKDYLPAEKSQLVSVSVHDIEEGTRVLWQFSDKIEPGVDYEFVTSGIVQKTSFDIYLTSESVLRNGQGNEIDSDSARVKVNAQGAYLRHLPELFRKDDLMSRFLMMFESFWKPIEQQIGQISNYFDPDLTTEEMLPWLASWVGAYWDELLPDNRKRKLIRVAASHYQRRGTKTVLEEYLTLYTDGQVEITEHPAYNLVLGQSARLGPKVALGLHNHPHTFTVDVKINKDDFDVPQEMDEALMQKVFRQKLDTIIELHKPAHTAHLLNIELINN